MHFIPDLHDFLHSKGWLFHNFSWLCNIYVVGIIRTSRVLDCESTSHYWLTIYATDRGLVPLHTRHEVYIKITDVNDNIPQMQQPIYFMNVTENAAEGTVVGQVQGYDDDITSQQELSYSIAETAPSSFFRINGITGNEILPPFYFSLFTL